MSTERKEERREKAYNLSLHSKLSHVGWIERRKWLMLSDPFKKEAVVWSPAKWGSNGGKWKDLINTITCGLFQWNGWSWRQGRV